MAAISKLADQKWRSGQLGDFLVHDCPLWESDNLYTCIYRLPKGFVFPHHTHRGWVQIFVLKGKMRVDLADGSREIGENEYYVVEEGDAHVEVVEDDETVIFVAAGESRSGLYDPVNLPGELVVADAVSQHGLAR
jgi:quercetin dioxygenase-like cupin family protein